MFERRAQPAGAPRDGGSHSTSRLNVTQLEESFPVLPCLAQGDVPDQAVVLALRVPLLPDAGFALDREAAGFALVDFAPADFDAADFDPVDFEAGLELVVLEAVDFGFAVLAVAGFGVPVFLRAPRAAAATAPATTAAPAAMAVFGFSFAFCFSLLAPLRIAPRLFLSSASSALACGMAELGMLDMVRSTLVISGW